VGSVVVLGPSVIVGTADQVHVGAPDNDLRDRCFWNCGLAYNEAQTIIQIRFGHSSRVVTANGNDKGSLYRCS